VRLEQTITHHQLVVLRQPAGEITHEIPHHLVPALREILRHSPDAEPVGVHAAAADGFHDGEDALTVNGEIACRLIPAVGPQSFVDAAQIVEHAIRWRHLLFQVPQDATDMLLRHPQRRNPITGGLWRDGQLTKPRLQNLHDVRVIAHGKTR